MDDEEDSKIFPQKLMDILCDPDPLVQESICWLPHGKAFIIRNRGMFEANIMPRFFNRKAKYSSFTRKLNRWNFSRVSSGPELGAYYHEFFRRDRPHLAAQMFCKNPRTMLAMAESKVARGGDADVTAEPGSGRSSNPVGASETHTTSPDLLRSSPGVGFSGLSLPAALSSGLAGLSAGDLDKSSADRTRAHLGGHHLHHPTSLVSLARQPPLPALPPRSQMLERQILLLQQQEEVNRLLLERALLLREQQRQEQGQNVAAAGRPSPAGTSATIPMYNTMLAEEQKLQDEFRLCQLLSVQLGPRAERRKQQKPSNNRASAA